MRNAVLGIDPGLAHVGVAVARFNLSRTQALYVATIETPSTASDDERLALIATELWAIAYAHRPEAVAYEDQSGVEVGMQRAGTGSNKWSRRVHDVCGMARMIAAALGVPCYAVAPSTAKLAFAGSGRATKDQMVSVARRVYGLLDVSEHGADALAVAKAGHRLATVARVVACARSVG